MVLQIEKEQEEREEAYRLIKRYGKLLMGKKGSNNKRRREVMKEIKKLAKLLNGV